MNLPPSSGSRPTPIGILICLMIVGGCANESAPLGSGDDENTAQGKESMAVPTDREVSADAVEETPRTDVPGSQVCVTLDDCDDGFICSAMTDPPVCVVGEAQPRGPLGQAPPPIGLFEVDPDVGGVQ